MAKRRVTLPDPEWSHPFEIAQLDGGPYELTISPTAQQAKDIARRLNVDIVDNFSAQITLEQLTGSHLIQVQGHLKADIAQKCVVTLQPINTHIRDEFDSFYADPKAVIPFAKGKVELERRVLNTLESEMLDEREDPEQIVDGKIDLGEMVVQYLSLAIDPYPQIPGALDAELPAEGKAEADNPFAALKVLQERKS